MWSALESNGRSQSDCQSCFGKIDSSQRLDVKGILGLGFVIGNIRYIGDINMIAL